MIGTISQTPGRPVELDQTITPEAALSQPGVYQFEEDRVIIPLSEETVVLDAAALRSRLRHVCEDAATNDDLRNFADRLERRLGSDTNIYTVSDATYFLRAAGAIPMPPVSYAGLSDERRVDMESRLNATLRLANINGDTDGAALVRRHLELLRVQ